MKTHAAGQLVRTLQFGEGISPPLLSHGRLGEIGVSCR